MTARPRVLTIDVGSSSARAAVYDATGTAVPGTPTRVPHQLTYGADGAAELRPATVLDSVTQAIDAVLAVLRRDGAGDVDAVALDTMWHSVCGVDAEGGVTVPLLTWADARAGEHAERLRRRLDEPAVHARTGCMLHPSYVPAKLAWLADTAPDAVRATARWLGPGEFLHTQLFGTATTGVSMASGTGLLDVHTCRYDAELLDVLGLAEDRLPPVTEEPARGLLPAWSRRWPELADVPWYPAIGDGAASNVGVGAVGAGRAALTIGTSGAMRLVIATDDVPVPAQLWCYRLDPHRFVIGGALSDGGNLVAWLRRTLQLPADADEQVVTMPVGGHGLTVLPMLAGERGPGWALHATGAVLGLRQATTPLDMYRATLEAVALRFALIEAQLDAAVPGARAVVGTGAALLHNPAWQQILADALGRRLLVADVAESSIRGTALCGLERLGALTLETLAAPPATAVEPDPGRRADYARLLARQVAVHDVLTADE